MSIQVFQGQFDLKNCKEKEKEEALYSSKLVFYRLYYAGDTDISYMRIVAFK